eukprot:15431039-Alexandrium_andersonii.AAC.1
MGKGRRPLTAGPSPGSAGWGERRATPSPFAIPTQAAVSQVVSPCPHLSIYSPVPEGAPTSPIALTFSCGLGQKHTRGS